MSLLPAALRDAIDLAPRAIEGGLLAGAACGAAGVVLRWRRLVWAGFAVPEAATAGTSFALGNDTLLPALGVSGALPSWLGWEPMWVFLATALAVLWLVPVARPARKGGERAASACFLLATTLTVLLVSLSPHGTEEVRALSTGKTLLFLAEDDVRTLAWTMPPLAALSALFAGPLPSLAFDRDHAQAAGRPVARLEAGFAAGFLALVALLAPRVGAPFVFAYLTLPAAAAERLVARPVPTVLAATVLGALGFLVGATAAVAWDLPFSTAAIAGSLAVSGLVVALRTLALGRLYVVRRAR